MRSLKVFCVENTDYILNYTGNITVVQSQLTTRNSFGYKSKFVKYILVFHSCDKRYSRLFSAKGEACQPAVMLTKKALQTNERHLLA